MVGILSRFRRGLPSTAPNGAPVHYNHLAPAPEVDVMGMSVEELWRTQPYLRTVVTFLARNVAQLGLHAFVRESDTDRHRVTDSSVPLLLSRPNERDTTYELVYGLVADLALYDEAFWTVQPADTLSGWRIDRIPPAWVADRGGSNAFSVGWYDLLPPGGKRAVRVEADQMLVFRGWNPDDTAYGSSPVHALKQILAEQINAHNYRRQVWERGGRVGAVLSRPAGAPPWSDDARGRFAKDWRSRWSGNDGAEAGGTPILEDGMTLDKVRFSAHEEEWAEAAKLSLTIVASVFHINPTMLGVLDNANYSNVREFRRMLYGDTLGPLIAMIEGRLNTFLAPRVEPGSGVYVEFNIGEKLKGSFEEQAQVMQTMVGAPIMTRDEGRARFNLPSMGADELVTPLNVLVGGQASPTDSGAQNRRPKARLHDLTAKAAPTDPQVEKIQQVMAAFFERQGKSVLSAMGAGGDWWDEKRWNDELADDLARVAHALAGILGPETAKALGYDADAYDPAMTVHFFQAVAADRAVGINATTREQLQEQVDAGEDGDPAQVFDTAKDSRSLVTAQSVATFAAGFATAEAARQIAKANGTRMVKTWRTGSNPRTSHARMNGETVEVDEKFSNGMEHPGQGDGTDANCNCRITVSEEGP